MEEFSCHLCAMLAQHSQGTYVIIYDVLNRTLKAVYCVSIYIIAGAVPLRVSPYFRYTSKQYFGKGALRFKTANKCDSQ